jgi:hypothetical protein
MLNLFGARKNTLALFGRHVVKLRKTVTHALLCLRGKIAEAGLIFESALLICKRKTAVMIHPLRQVLLIGLRTNLLPLSRVRGVHGRPRRLTHFVH